MSEILSTVIVDSNKSVDIKAKRSFIRLYQSDPVKTIQAEKTYANYLKVFCPCRKIIDVRVSAYKCLECGIWFCRKCAKRHFGRGII